MSKYLTKYIKLIIIKNEQKLLICLLLFLIILLFSTLPSLIHSSKELEFEDKIEVLMKSKKG